MMMIIIRPTGLKGAMMMILFTYLHQIKKILLECQPFNFIFQPMICRILMYNKMMGVN